MSEEKSETKLEITKEAKSPGENESVSIGIIFGIFEGTKKVDFPYPKNRKIIGSLKLFYFSWNLFIKPGWSVLTSVIIILVCFC